ncbi:MAG TPA: hypothetical protein VI968_03385 [archaeon]|nr:hypothetical protein [archaeon]
MIKVRMGFGLLVIILGIIAVAIPHSMLVSWGMDFGIEDIFIKFIGLMIIIIGLVIVQD